MIWRKVLLALAAVLIGGLSIYNSDIADETFQVLPVLLIGYVFLLFVEALLHGKDLKIADLNQKLLEETKGLFSYYKELKEYDIKKEYQRFMKAFVRDQPYVCSVQLYEYIVKSTSPYKHRIQLNYVDGNVSANEKLNAIVQDHFDYNKREIREVKKVYKELNNAEMNDDHNSFESLSKSFQLLNRYNKKLNSFHTHDDDTSLKLSLMQLMGDLIEKRIDAAFTDDHLLSNPQLEQRLIRMRKTGIARAIVKYEFFEDHLDYFFRYSGDGDAKSGRHYIASIKKSNRGKNYLFLITVSPDLWSNSDEVKQSLNEIKEEFNSFLNESDIVYNNK
ncbi:hypothetical protein [Pontibacillus salipaludis]|uniref:Phage abortive infection protein n=1 Tax=Pontibacillus salipaludis TaxID=1697394 RepID=A0ABQ1QL01_9BACI|nr:hypothetical protein [Pontibacillus salipaludis]GGD29714.1 hypothetical protein GCM10011389_41600 [Pontibacillus salipaludis]